MNDNAVRRIMKEAHESNFKFLKNIAPLKLLELETLDERTIKYFSKQVKPAPIAEDEYPSETEAASLKKRKSFLANAREQAEGKRASGEE